MTVHIAYFIEKYLKKEKISISPRINLSTLQNEDKGNTVTEILFSTYLQRKKAYIGVKRTFFIFVLRQRGCAKKIDLAAFPRSVFTHTQTPFYIYIYTYFLYPIPHPASRRNSFNLLQFRFSPTRMHKRVNYTRLLSYITSAG